MTAAKPRRPRHDLTKSQQDELRRIARSGPLQRGSFEWERRENARIALGCSCISHGIIPEGEAHGERRYGRSCAA